MRFQNPFKDIYQVHALKIFFIYKGLCSPNSIISLIVNQRKEPLDQLSIEMTHRRIDAK